MNTQTNPGSPYKNFRTAKRIRDEHEQALADALLPHLLETGERDINAAFTAFLASGGGRRNIEALGGRVLILFDHGARLLPRLHSRWRYEHQKGL